MQLALDLSLSISIVPRPPTSRGPKSLGRQVEGPRRNPKGICVAILETTLETFRQKRVALASRAQSRMNIAGYFKLSDSRSVSGSMPKAVVKCKKFALNREC
ncbi:hypothetical protein ALC57_08583 [Trachymyrmex cornetzi]|uniref:Uncharacterized protein n=1 Tax=Trachymyrmex cornetzi TaxID=471704 RepID=A0A151J6Z1_9HYME|nr:hypothetical protein ALC57_08583 [Trachymyrmex cornetzi]